MKSYRDLEVFKLSKALAISTHEMSLNLPKFEMYEEASQIRRSSKAVTSNIVEGYGRRMYKADFVRHLVFAISECDETAVHLDFLFETNSLNNETIYLHLKSEYEKLGKMINAFIIWVEQNWKPGIPKTS